MHDKSKESDGDVTSRHPVPTRPKTALAVALNCLVPGSGLAYLGRWSLAIANFVIVLVVVVGCFVANDPTLMEHIHWVLMVLVVGSGALAHGVAKSQG
jgi:hypothetical protein